MKFLLILSLSCLFLQNTVSQSDMIVNQTLSISGGTETVSANGNTYLIQQSIGQPGIIGTFSSGDNTVRQGFIQPNVMDAVLSNKVPIILETQLYPNPFKNSISIVLKNVTNTNVTIKLYDVLGRSVFSKEYYYDHPLNIDFQNLSSGQYIINIITPQKQFVGKIIKNN